MTVSQDILKSGPYNTDGTTKAFSVTFQYLEDTDIVVTLLNTTSGAALTGVLNQDYTVSDNVSPIIGGTVTIANNGFSGIANAAGIIPSGYTITLNPSIPLLQEESYPNAGLFPSAAVEQALDRLTLICQGLQLNTTQSLRYPVTDSATISNILPNSTLRASAFLAFDSLGNPIAAAGVTGVTVSSPMLPVVEASSVGAALTLLGGLSTTAAASTYETKASAALLAPLANAAMTGILTINGHPVFSKILVTLVSTSGTFTLNSATQYVSMRGVGGGGAGGGTASPSSSGFSGGGGGASGGYSEKSVVASVFGASQTVTIGAAGVASSGAAGGNGGTTSVGTVMVANGGNGGGLATSLGAAGGGSGPSAGTGDLALPGISGFSTASFSSGINQGVSTHGANSLWGSGGYSTPLTSGNFITGNAASGYGAGGGGGANFNQTTAAAGGNGTQGAVLFVEYLSG